MEKEKGNSKNIVLDEKWAEEYIAWLQSLPHRNGKGRKRRQKHRFRNMHRSNHRSNLIPKPETRIFRTKIVGIEMRNSEDRKYLFCTFAITDGAFGCRKIFTQISLDGNNNARFKYLYLATGLTFNLGISHNNHEELLGRELKLEVEDWIKDSARLVVVKRFLPLTCKE